MLHFRKTIISVLALFFGITSVSANPAEKMKMIGQYVVVSLDTNDVQSIYLEPDEIGTAVFSEKLDDLVSSWYINNIFLAKDVDTDFTLYRHISVSDSVLIGRLKKVEAAVKLSYNNIVRDWIEMYATRRPAQVEIMLGLSAYYFPFFEEIFDRYELPHELKYMAIIESALNPRAVSRAGATGLWQFMLGTAKGLNLEVTTFVDERRDVLKATDAAARYLKQLYNVYQDWHLVIAAYNCGPGNVNKAITRSGGKTDYWQMYYALPRETRGYVPAYIAATYIMNYYREHQLTPRFPAMALNTDTIMVGQMINLKQISDNLTIDLEALRELNPMYRRDIVPGSPEKSYPVRVPADQVSDFILRSETIYNHERDAHFPDNTLVAPQNSVIAGETEFSTEGKTRIMYTVKSGDNPGYIANWFNISLNDLRNWNNIRRNMIRTGQKLVIYVPEEKVDHYKRINNLSFSAKQALVGKPVTSGQVSEKNERPQRSEAASEDPDYEYYTVKQGDNLWTIAQKYPGISNTDIMKLNNISDVKGLKAGQRLKIRPKS
ncbi:MAG: LysM peptidoglycan-binding domain-containing protein [Prolixibacteraceae bacterium]|jgi:membrane-bound lytic murein transglycosylase D|nr:LysM peptidoglycan-binding domain-containing protein [Prolixibacteraceae bacterium]MDI9562645.1 LysM peptidoglycan-binding domain-containing protein [Bacteroidota bacterium]NLT00272.1 LysM peptidoglycan-binding domain-containing protein [Bacteroidales bacterium]OQB79121.1 MAG: Membrane-bound lytic murein transglycosylase D precursor [Bacteroidetes bacterium ADurb.Bin123]HOC86918.1 LysM peptidoglycan-binding domain-containing protein [Prolixibacteraceae bacterium]